MPIRAQGRMPQDSLLSVGVANLIASHSLAYNHLGSVRVTLTLALDIGLPGARLEITLAVPVLWFVIGWYCWTAPRRIKPDARVEDPAGI